MVVTQHPTTRTSRATAAATSTPKEKGSRPKSTGKDQSSTKRRRGATLGLSSDSEESVVSVSLGGQTRKRKSRSTRRSTSISADSGDTGNSGEKAKKKKPSSLKSRKAGSKKSSKKDKRKKKKKLRSSSSSDDSLSSSEDKVEMIDKTIHVNDGVSRVAMELRHRLRTPMGAPDSWWKLPFKSNVSRPVRGASLNMEPVLVHARMPR